MKTRGRRPAEDAKPQPHHSGTTAGVSRTTTPTVGRTAGTNAGMDEKRGAATVATAAAVPDDPDADNDSDDSDDSDNGSLAACPVDGCHESLPKTEMAYHVNLHAALDYVEEGEASGGAQEERAAAVVMSGGGGGGGGGGPSDDDGAAETRDARHARHRARRERRHQHHHGHRHGHDRAASEPKRRPSAAAAAPEARPRPARSPAATLRAWLAFWAGTAVRTRSQPTSGTRTATTAATKNGKGKAAAAPDTPRRLGKAELGKYADEERMPDTLAAYLEKEWGVRHQGIVPVLKQLLEQSPTTEYAYLCDPCVQHVSRLPKEGGFCGYRNLQTLVSYIVGAQYPGHELFGDALPSVFDLQDRIERAWDRGFNARGRIETGGVRGTRKYIGTPEAAAMFHSLAIPCSVRAFASSSGAATARDLLLRDVEQYFARGRASGGGGGGGGGKVRATTLPPIYWQHPGHSLTIVGLERTTAGDTNLLVFDPIFRDGHPVARLVGRRRFEHHFPDQLLKPYRRGARYLGRFRAFEVLKLRPRPEDVADGQGSL